MSIGQILGLIVGLATFAAGFVFLLDSGDDGPGATPTVTGPAARAASAAGPRVVIWAVGDGADGGSHGRTVAELIASRGVERFIYLGDVYEEGTADEFERNYEPLFGSLDGIAAPTVGNHEEGNEAVGYYPYWRAAKGTPVPPWYSFSAAGWQVLSLNSTEPRGTASGQLRWLRKQLSSRKWGSCRIAFMHHPRYSAGRYRDDRSLAPITGALRGRATLLLAGHDHNMQRFRPIGGLTQLISGTGGHGLYPVRSRDPRLRFSDDSHYGALRLVLAKGRATASFVSTEGRVLDRSGHRC